MSLFPADLKDPWSEGPENEGLSPVVTSMPILVSSNPPAAAENDYIQDLIYQNEELTSAIDLLKKSSVPQSYTNLYKTLVRKDGKVDFLEIEKVFDKSGLNQISIDNIVNLVTMNKTIDFTTINLNLWNVLMSMVCLEQEELGSANFQNLQQSLKEGTLKEVVMEGNEWQGENNNTIKIQDQSVRKEFSINNPDIITVAQLQEKEGIVFKHVIYLVGRVDSTTKKVIRRYSDFVWLYEVLLKKYPFRLIPGLPPKKFSVGPASDPLFLDRRKRGLARFLNIIMKHPVISKEAMVVMFLTIPTELSIWRKQTSPEIIEEFEGKRISKNFIENWDAKIEVNWKNAEDSMIEIQNNWAKIALLVERLEKRKQLYAADNMKLVDVLNSFTINSSKLYPVEPSDIGSINNGMKIVANHIKTSSFLLKDETQSIEDGILKDFKEFNEYLTSLFNLFERRKSYEITDVNEIKIRIESNQKKLLQLKKKSDVKGSEIENLVSAINDDKELIIKQTNRSWLIKECLLQEFLLFQETQYKISQIWIEWTTDNLKYGELHSENWSQLMDSIGELPTE